MNYFITLFIVSVVAVKIGADDPAPIPSGIQKLFDETPLPCTPHDVPCYFCKCNFHGNRQHCVYTCNPETDRPVMPGSQMCTADDEFTQGCKRCRCSRGQLFFDCFLSDECSEETVPEDEF